MSIQTRFQTQVRLHGAGKAGVRTQFVALPWRMEGEKLRLCLITSRTNRRWILPKGWPMDGLTPAECAEREAWEEAGLRGKTSDICIGVFSYVKPLDRMHVPCLGMVFPLKVKSVAGTWPERRERRRRWVSPKKAAKMLAEVELRRIVLALDPQELRR